MNASSLCLPSTAGQAPFSPFSCCIRSSWTVRCCKSEKNVTTKDMKERADEEDSSSGTTAAATSDAELTRKLFLLDVAPLCYTGKRPTPSGLARWLRPLLQLTCSSPIIAVLDGSRGNEYRRNLLSTYKSNRNTYVPLSSLKSRQTWKGDDADLREAFPCIRDFLQRCHIPVACIENAEADDVVATLADQAMQRNFQVAIASPDKDFKQLLCESVQIVVPLSDLQRWSFYTHRDYFNQHKCHPDIEISLRCLLGDKVDGIPGLTDLVPGFGRNTALKLLKKYGSLENLLREASIRTVGKPYVQNALSEHGSYLWRNIEVLQLRRNLPIQLKEEWCLRRDFSKDSEAFELLKQRLEHLRVERALKDGVSNTHSLGKVDL